MPERLELLDGPLSQAGATALIVLKEIDLVVILLAAQPIIGPDEDGVADGNGGLGLAAA